MLDRAQRERELQTAEMLLQVLLAPAWDMSKEQRHDTMRAVQSILTDSTPRPPPPPA